MLPDVRFVIGAFLAAAMLVAAAFGLAASVRLAHEAKVAPHEASRSFAANNRAPWPYEAPLRTGAGIPRESDAQGADERGEPTPAIVAQALATVDVTKAPEADALVQSATVVGVGPVVDTAPDMRVAAGALEVEVDPRARAAAVALQSSVLSPPVIAAAPDHDTASVALEAEDTHIAEIPTGDADRRPPGELPLPATDIGQTPEENADSNTPPIDGILAGEAPAGETTVPAPIFAPSGIAGAPAPTTDGAEETMEPLNIAPIGISIPRLATPTIMASQDALPAAIAPQSDTPPIVAPTSVLLQTDATPDIAPTSTVTATANETTSAIPSGKPNAEAHDIGAELEPLDPLPRRITPDRPRTGSTSARRRSSHPPAPQHITTAPRHHSGQPHAAANPPRTHRRAPGAQQPRTTRHAWQTAPKSANTPRTRNTKVTRTPRVRVLNPRPTVPQPYASTGYPVTMQPMGNTAPRRRTFSHPTPSNPNYQN